MPNIFLEVNGEQHVTVELDESTYFDILGNPEYGVNYVKDLINNKLIQANVLTTLRVSKDNINFVDIQILPETESQQTCEERAEKVEWEDAATKFLLDKYQAYLTDVGPMKTFKLKKQMWQQISGDLLTVLKIEKSPLQCENRFKTVMKRKKRAIDINKTSGQSPVIIEYETELEKIVAIDDSLEPEVKMGIGRFEIKKSKIDEPDENSKKRGTLTKDQKLKKKETKDISDVLWKIHKDKEENKERRHKEKLELLKEIGKNLLQGSQSAADNTG